jgi:hypothetical protein
VTSSLTPQQVIDTLSAIGRDIDEQTANIAELDRAAVQARVALKVRHAEIFLRTEGSMDLRRYTADYGTRDELLMSELADQEHRAAVNQIKALRDRLEVGRSISALVRMEWTTA